MPEDNGPSEHLSWKELECHDGTPYPEIWRKDRAIELAAAFEAVRKLCGFPIIVDSAFRTIEYNKKLPGSARNSQHCEGRALDLRPQDPKRLKDLRGAVVEVRENGLIRGVGIYEGFVHIDTRPGKNATWFGQRSSNVAPGTVPGFAPEAA